MLSLIYKYWRTTGTHRSAKSGNVEPVDDAIWNIGGLQGPR